jgi:CBS domain-containing protein
MNVVRLHVEDYMDCNPVTIEPQTEITRAVHKMIECDVSGLLVVKPGNRLVGIITERDCIAAASAAGYYGEWGGPVHRFMTAPVETVAPRDSLVDIAARMVDSTFRRFPVVEDDRLLGVLGRRDVLRALEHGDWFSTDAAPGP